MEKESNKMIKHIKNKLNHVKQACTLFARFLDEGKWGGILLCGLLATQFIYGVLFQSVTCILPVSIAFPACLILVAGGTEIVLFLLKIILGVKNRGRIYFFLAFATVGISAAAATQFENPLPGFILGFVVSLSVDLFGRCVFSICIKRNYRVKSGYILGFLSLCVIILFGLFFHLDRFGEMETDRYFAMNPVNERNESDRKEAFLAYMENGAYQVKTLDYGQGTDADIQTTTVDLSAFAKREGLTGVLTNLYFDYSLKEAPIAGRVWYPEGCDACPVLFIAHGNHEFHVPSYSGYDYLGTYLASNGYVVVSVDENALNELSEENDARAVLFLENIKEVLKENNRGDSPLFQKIDENKIAIAGHSRGGEMAALAYLFNDLDVYPDNGNIRFDYHFNISSVIAIAPSVDQYMPAGHGVKISDVNYLLLHGSNDHDVTTMMGEKQYHNVCFSGKGDYCKASVYIFGANHGQFNTLWGRYDLNEGLNGFLNTANLISADEQQVIAKIYIRTFLDVTLLSKDDFADLLTNVSIYRECLPRTIYQTNFQSGNFEPICSFDEDADLVNGCMDGVSITCKDVTRWSERVDIYGFGGDGENYVMNMAWKEKAKEPRVEIDVPSLDLTQADLSFRIGDMREDENLSPVHYSVVLYDAKDHRTQVTDPVFVYPSLALKLYKQDILMNHYEYKHQMQTVSISSQLFQGDAGFDFSDVRKIIISFDGAKKGNVTLDDIGVTGETS